MEAGDKEVEIISHWEKSKWFCEEHSSKMAFGRWIGYYRHNDQKCGETMLQREEQEPGSEVAFFGHSQEIPNGVTGPKYWVSMGWEWEMRKAG